MTYNIGDVIESKETVNTTCLEMSNPEFDIKPGDLSDNKSISLV